MDNLWVDKAISISDGVTEVIVRSDADGLFLVEVVAYDTTRDEKTHKSTKTKLGALILTPDIAEKVADALRELAAHERAQEAARYARMEGRNPSNVR